MDYDTNTIKAVHRTTASLIAHRWIHIGRFLLYIFIGGLGQMSFEIDLYEFRTGKGQSITYKFLLRFNIKIIDKHSM